MILIKDLLRDLRRLWRVYRGEPLPSKVGEAPRTGVIMGAQVLKGGRPSPALQARTRHAARLYEAGDLDLLIPTGGLGEYPPREAVLMREILRREGVPDEGVLLEDQAMNTWDSAVRVAEISHKRAIDGVRVITDPLHCLRAVWAFQEMGFRTWAEPAYGSPMWRKPWSRRRQLVREAAATVWYRVRYRAGSRSRP